MAKWRKVVVRVANAAGVSAAKQATYCTRQALTKPGHYGPPDVVLLSEVAPVNVAQVAMFHAPGMNVLQYGVRGSAASGVAIVSRNPMRNVNTITGSPATGEGGGIRARPLVTAGTFGLRFTSGHAPPPRSPIARAIYIAWARTRRGIVGADWNRDPKWMRATSTRRYRGHGVLGALVPRKHKATKAHAVNIGSDHPAVDFVIKVKS